MLSRTARYALSALTVLARREPRVLPVSDMARELELPANYLAKTLDRLRAAGLVEAVRGRHGGFRLARPAGGVVLSDIVRALDAPDTEGECLMGRGSCGEVGGCPLHRSWQAASGPAFAFLNEHTLADVAGAAEPWPPPDPATRAEGAIT